MKLKCFPARRAAPAAGWLFSVLHWPSPETTEWFCLRTALWWVLQLAPCLHLFAVNTQFDGLKHYGPEGRWQMVIAGLLLGQVLAVCLGRVWMRVSFLVAFAAVWGFFAGMFWASSPHLFGIARNTGVGVYISLAADCLIVAGHLVYRWLIDHWTRQERLREKNRSCPSPS